MFPQTKMATETEVEGKTTVSVPPAIAEGLAREEAQVGENQTAPVPAEEATAEESATGEAQPTRKERRISEFIDKLKDKDKENSALRVELDKLKGVQPQSLTDNGVQPQSPAGIPPWGVPQVQPEAEITPEQYTQHVVGAAHTLTTLEINRFKQDMAKFDNFKDDLRYVEGKYDVLNPDRPERYNKETSTKIANLYRQAAAGNPGLRLKDFVESVMSFHQEGRSEGMKEVTPGVLRNEAEGAIPPSTPEGRRSGSVDINSMTEKEMEAYLKANGLWD